MHILQRRLVWILLAVGGVMLVAPLRQSVAAKEKTFFQNRIMFSDKGLTPQEFRFLGHMLDLQPIDFLNADIKTVTPQIRNFIGKQFNDEMGVGNFTIEYDVPRKTGDKTLLNGVTIKFKDKNDVTTLKISFFENSPQWRSVDLITENKPALLHRYPSLGYMETHTSLGKVSMDDRKTILSCHFHPNGMLAKLTYINLHGILQGRKEEIHEKEWDKRGDLLPKKDRPDTKDKAQAASGR